MPLCTKYVLAVPLQLAVAAGAGTLTASHWHTGTVALGPTGSPLALALPRTTYLVLPYVFSTARVVLRVLPEWQSVSQWQSELARCPREGDPRTTNPRQVTPF